MMNEVSSFFARNSSLYLNIFADCIPVNGAKQLAIYDLTRRNIYRVPSSYYPLCTLFREMPLGKIVDFLASDEDENHLYSFITFLLENELAMFISNPSLFPEIEVRYEQAETINNAIIDIKDAIHDFKSIFEQLSELGCKYIQLRFFSDVFSINQIDDILKEAYHKSIISIEVILHHNKQISKEDYIKFYEKHVSIVSSIIIHSSPENETLEVDFEYKGDMRDVITREIYFIKKIKSANCCGIINESTLGLTGVKPYMINKLYNSCLYSKISIDENGKIKNCPSFNVNYGNVCSTKIRNVVNNPDFQKYWSINKDRIEVCKDCELRYACSDCRVFITDPANIYSKPAKCTYNPYVCEWQEEDRHISVK